MSAIVKKIFLNIGQNILKNSVYLRNNTSRQSFTKKFYQNQFIINSTHVQNSGSYIHVHVFNHPDMKMAEQRSNIVTDVSWKKKRREIEEDRKALGIVKLLELRGNPVSFARFLWPMARPSMPTHKSSPEPTI